MRLLRALLTCSALTAVALAGLAASSAALSAQPRSPAPPTAAAPPADLIFTNARIYTVDDGRPIAHALAVRDGRVQFVGSERGALMLRGPNTQVRDLDGRTVIPGMIDAHAHLVGLGEALRTVDLKETRSYQAVIERVVARARETPAGEWIIGRGWDQNDWGNTSFPTHEELSRAVPDHPVYLTRIDGHAALVNARAMQLAEVVRTTPDPIGGRLERTAAGDPTGVFVDNAQDIVGRRIPATTAQELRAQIDTSIAEMHRWGLTGMHDAGATRQTLYQYEALARSGALDLRLYAMIGDDSATIAHYLQRGPQSALHDGRLWIRSIKLYGDGALGSRGAALLDAYSDDPGNTGLLVSPQTHIRSVAERALRTGFQVNVHAIGDRGNRMVLDAFDDAFTTVPRTDHRFRVEHAQILNHQDLNRFADMDVIPSMQAVHQSSDMYWAANRLGVERLRGAYAWRSLLDTGMPIPNGSDFPVERVNPLFSFHAAISRQDDDNYPAGGWYPEQRMTREEALKSITIWPAYAGFQESLLGSLTAGKYADFVVLDQDIMRAPAESVLGTRVLETWIGGKRVYQRAAGQ